MFVFHIFPGHDTFGLHRFFEINVINSKRVPVPAGPINVAGEGDVDGTTLKVID